MAASFFPFVARAEAGERPLRLAAPDRGAAQTLLSLGLVPVVSVSREFFDAMGTKPTMPEGVVDCGDPSEPNLEVIARMNVDLIVTSTISADIREVLSRVAPVRALDIYTGLPDAVSRAKRGAHSLATELGATVACNAYLKDFDSTIVALRSKLAPWPRRPVYLVGLAPDGRNMTVYGRNSLMWDVMDALGIENAWRGPTNVYGFTNAGVERLADRPDAMIVSIDYGDLTATAMQTLARSVFWANLPAVNAERIFTIPRFEVFGTLPAAAQFAPLFADTLLSTSQ